MEFKELVSVTGLSGLFRMVKSRQDGLIVEDITTKAKKFISARNHQFSPLESISIYTDSDTTELKKIFVTMKDMDEAGDGPVEPKASNHDLKEYFEDVLPNYDKDKVYVSDIKKVIKWYNFLKEQELLGLLAA